MQRAGSGPVPVAPCRFLLAAGWPAARRCGLWPLPHGAGALPSCPPSADRLSAAPPGSASPLPIEQRAAGCLDSLVDARCGLDFLLSLAGPWAVGLNILVGRHSVFLRPIREQRDCSLSSTSSPPFTLHPASKIHGGALGGLHGSGGGRGGSSPP